MSRYRETLNTWATQFIPAGSTVSEVVLGWDEGYNYSSYTFEDPHVNFTVFYIGPNCQEGIFSGSSADLPTMGALLTELFRIEDSEDA